MPVSVLNWLIKFNILSVDPFGFSVHTFMTTLNKKIPIASFNPPAIFDWIFLPNCIHYECQYTMNRTDSWHSHLFYLDKNYSRGNISYNNFYNISCILFIRLRILSFKVAKCFLLLYYEWLGPYSAFLEITNCLYLSFTFKAMNHTYWFLNGKTKLCF